MTNLELVDFCRKTANFPTLYMWGDYGRTITASTIAAKAKQYPSHYTKERQAYLTDAIGDFKGCDCSGLIKWFLWTDGDISVTPRYTASTDLSASGWYSNAKIKGGISSMPETPGLILYLPGHCGVYLGEGKVAECTRSSFGDGVVITNLVDRKWTKWCECSFITYTAPEAEAAPPFEFRNGNSITSVFSNTKLSQEIGEIYSGELCECYGTYGECALIVYNTDKLGKKVGFVRTESGKISKSEEEKK